MTRTYTIDRLVNEIKDSKTKEYFKEVLSSYYSENYRSAVVMLYSIVICDLVYKLQELRDQFNDSNAKGILQEIDRLQTEKPTLSDWENKLIEMVKTQTKILEHSDYQNIIHLQKHRHLCAHPVILQSYKLFSPNKDTVRAHIINSLEGLLIKPALLSKKILGDFLKNLVEIKDILVTEADITTHLGSKYFENLNKTIEKDIFRSMWKIVFKLDNTKCEENREINYKALKIICNRNYTEILDFIESDKQYFSNNIDLKCIPWIISFMNVYPDIYLKLNSSAKTLIKKTIENDNNYTFTAFFLKDNLASHLKDLKAINHYEFNGSISIKSILELNHICLSQGLNSESNALLIRMFIKSSNFDQADARFDKLIEPYLGGFNLIELTEIVEGVIGNGQINDRRLARTTNKEIVDEVMKRDSKFDWTLYSGFNF